MEKNIGEQYSLAQITEETITRIINGAAHHSVTRKRLLETSGLSGTYLSGDPIISYLHRNEQPHYIYTHRDFETSNRILYIPGDGEMYETPTTSDYYTYMIFTEGRLLAVAGDESGDEYISLPYENVTDIKFDKKDDIYNTSPLAGVVSVGTPTGVYKIGVDISDKKDIQLAIEYLWSMGIGNDVENGGVNVDYVRVCRECKGEVAPDAERCPHCKFSPKENKHGNLYWGGTAALSATGIGALIGLPLAAKGASDEFEGRKNLSKKGVNISSETGEQPDEPATSTISELERLNRLKKEGALSEEEFDRLKQDLLK